MMGVFIDGPTNGVCDNKSVVTNATQPHSTLTKKHNAIAYHKVRESVSSKAIRFAYERGQNNLSDVLTKSLGATLLGNALNAFSIGNIVLCLWNKGTD